ncbi:MAG TPA: hypothetical protein VGD77_15175 [Gemmatimonadaceae bacterium]
MARHSSPIRLIRRACRRCRNYTGNVVTRCPCCGAPFPRVRFAALPVWVAGAGAGAFVIVRLLGRG